LFQTRFIIIIIVASSQAYSAARQPVPGPYVTNLSKFDTQKIIGVFLNRFDIFASKQSSLHRRDLSLAHDILQIRNRWAHNDHIDDFECVRVLSSIRTLLRDIGAPDEALQIGELSDISILNMASRVVRHHLQPASISDPHLPLPASFYFFEQIDATQRELLRRLGPIESTAAVAAVAEPLTSSARSNAIESNNYSSRNDSNSSGGGGGGGSSNRDRRSGEYTSTNNNRELAQRTRKADLWPNGENPFAADYDESGMDLT
jgi:hypothetical protein